jgi:hypothetical protein
VAGTLLVAGQDVADRAVEERVVGRKDGPAGHTEDDVHPFVLEGSDECLGSVHGVAFLETKKPSAGEGFAYACMGRMRHITITRVVMADIGRESIGQTA